MKGVTEEFMDFYYNFDMGLELPSFDRMPEQIQEQAEVAVVRIIYESFVVPGDHDYLMSRLLAKERLSRGFYWAAAQAIEKYLKTFLLMNGKDVRKFSHTHPIRALLDAASQLDASICSLDIHPHRDIRIANGQEGKVRKFRIEDFIQDIGNYGGSDSRYNAHGVRYNTGHLLALDSLLFHLRNRLGVPSICESFKDLSPELVTVFEKNNPWFRMEENVSVVEIPSEEFPIVSSGACTTLEYALKYKHSPAYKLALQWLGKKMKVRDRSATST
jgi:hypothetical protein